MRATFLFLGLSALAWLPAQAAGQSKPIAAVAIGNDAAPRLEADPPLPALLARGIVYIAYRTGNIRMVPVYGQAALDVSPRVGHLHVTVDGAPWHWVDASNEPIILAGLAPGPHKILLELADPAHKVVASRAVEFVVPATGAAHSH